MAETAAEKLRRKLGLPPKQPRQSVKWGGTPRVEEPAEPIPGRQSVKMGGPGLPRIDEPGTTQGGLPAYPGAYQGKAAGRSTGKVARATPESIRKAALAALAKVHAADAYNAEANGDDIATIRRITEEWKHEKGLTKRPETVGTGLPAEPGAYQGAGAARPERPRFSPGLDRDDRITRSLPPSMRPPDQAAGRREGLQRALPPSMRRPTEDQGTAGQSVSIEGADQLSGMLRGAAAEERAAAAGGLAQQRIDLERRRVEHLERGDQPPDVSFEDLSPQERTDVLDEINENPVYAPQLQSVNQEIAATEQALGGFSEEPGGPAEQQQAERLVGHLETLKRRRGQIASNYVQNGVGGAESAAKVRAKRRMGETYVEPNTGAVMTLDRNGAAKVLIEGPNLEKITDSAVKAVQERHAATPGTTYEKSKPATPFTQKEIDEEVKTRLDAYYSARRYLASQQERPQQAAPEPQRPAAAPTAQQAAAPQSGFLGWVEQNYPDLAQAAASGALERASERSLKQQYRAATFGATAAFNYDELAAELEANGIEPTDENIDRYLASPQGQAFISSQ